MMVEETKSLISSYMSDLRKESLFSGSQIDKNLVISWIEDYKKTGDLEKREMVIRSAMYMVVKQAIYFSGLYDLQEYLLDLIQEGNIGLLEAIEYFEKSFGRSYVNYARYHVNSYMLKFILKRLSDRSTLLFLDNPWSEESETKTIEVLFADPDSIIRIIEDTYLKEVRQKLVGYLRQYYKERDVNIFLLRTGLPEADPKKNFEVALALGLSTNQVKVAMLKIIKNPHFRWFFTKLLHDNSLLPEPAEIRAKLEAKAPKPKELPLPKRKVTQKTVQLICNLIAEEFGITFDAVIAATKRAPTRSNTIPWWIAWLLYENSESSMSEVAEVFGESAQAFFRRTRNCTGLMSKDSEFKEKMLRISEKIMGTEWV